MAPPLAVTKALDGRDERPPVSALNQCFQREKGGFGAAVVVLSEGLSWRCHWSGLGPRYQADGLATGEPMPRRRRVSVAVAIRRSSIRVDLSAEGTKKYELVRMSRVMDMASLGYGVHN